MTVVNEVNKWSITEQKWVKFIKKHHLSSFLVRKKGNKMCMITLQNCEIEWRIVLKRSTLQWDQSWCFSFDEWKRPVFTREAFRRKLLRIIGIDLSLRTPFTYVLFKLVFHLMLLSKFFRGRFQYISSNKAATQLNLMTLTWCDRRPQHWLRFQKFKNSPGLLQTPMISEGFQRWHELMN